VRFWDDDQTLGADIDAKSDRVVMMNVMLSLAVSPSTKAEALIE
jgi:hypothetical protein